MTLAPSFFELYSGFDRARGQTVLLGDVTAKGKHEAKSTTVKEAPTEEHWEDHLAGKTGLGICPLRDDGTVSWGCIDIDQYPIDFSGLENAVRGLKLPLTVVASKSMGAHLFLFTSEPVSAKLVRDKLGEWMAALGFAGLEIFPKQVKLASDNDYGNWLNMPYFGDTRKAYIDGEFVDAETFVLHAYQRRLNTIQLEGFNVEVDDKTPFMDGPPCLQVMAQKTVEEGGRNIALFNMAIYLRRKFENYSEDDLTNFLGQCNSNFILPPLNASTLNDIIRSTKKKSSYNYNCDKDPLRLYCNRALCLKREFGISQQKGTINFDFGPIVRLDTQPVTWIVTVDGIRISMSSNDLLSMRYFKLRVFEETGKVLSFPTPMEWDLLVNERAQQAEKEDVPVDVRKYGELYGLLESYCSDTALAETKDEMLEGLPWKDNDKETDYPGWVYFRGNEFRQFVSKRGGRYDHRDLWQALRACGAKHGQFSVRGKCVTWWAVPGHFSQKTEDIETSDISFGDDDAASGEHGPWGAGDGEDYDPLA